MFPLSARKPRPYAFKQKPWYSIYHLGQDYEANYVPIYAPFNGKIVRQFWGAQGGNTIWFEGNGQKMRFMHLSKFTASVGNVKQGQQIGITGNTGLSSAAHLHIDLPSTFDGAFYNNINNFSNPEAFNWVGNVASPPTPTGYPKKVTVAVNKLYVRTAPNTGAPLGGDQYLMRGTTITVTGVVTGQNVSGNDRWYKTIKNNYCWSGGFS